MKTKICSNCRGFGTMINGCPLCGKIRDKAKKAFSEVFSSGKKAPLTEKDKVDHDISISPRIYNLSLKERERFYVFYRDDVLSALCGLKEDIYELECCDETPEGNKLWTESNCELLKTIKFFIDKWFALKDVEKPKHGGGKER